MVVAPEKGGAAAGSGRSTRLGFALQVGFATLLAVAVCGMLVHLAEWRKLRFRVDLTASGKNTLDSQTQALLTGFDEPVAVDVFFRAADYEHLFDVTAEAQRRMSELLFVAKTLAPARLEIEIHDLYDLAATRKRMDELGLDEEQTVVVSRGERRAVLRLFAEIAQIDPGNPDPRAPRPATLRSFRGEEALAEALKKVSADDSPRVYFSTGHGEADPFGSDNRQLGRLVAELERQGFEVDTWEGAVVGPVPSDCDVLAVVGPEQPFSAREREYVEGWVAAGGRLLAATETRYAEEAESVAGMLRRHGMLLSRGMVCMPVLDYFGSLRTGTPECADFRIAEREMNAEHPVTAPLVERARKLRFVFSRSFDRTPAGESTEGILLDLASSPAESWRDVPETEGASLDFALDSARESRGRFRLAMARTFPVSASLDVGSGPREGRVVGIASPYFLSNGTFSTNRDFALNAFNWLAERDFRVGVSARDPESSVVDVSRGPALAVVFHSSLWALPGVFGLLGLFTYIRRRR